MSRPPAFHPELEAVHPLRGVVVVLGPRHLELRLMPEIERKSAQQPKGRSRVRVKYPQAMGWVPWFQRCCETEFAKPSAALQGKKRKTKQNRKIRRHRPQRERNIGDMIADQQTAVFRGNLKRKTEKGCDKL